MEINLKEIGYVHNQVEEKKHHSWGDEISTIRLNKEYSGGFLGLEQFSHVTILFYLDQAKYDRNKHLQRRPRSREDMPLLGVFAQRGKDRPNQIGMSTVKIIRVEDDELTVAGLDALDNTPVLDVKAYFPIYDCKRDANSPKWVDRLLKDYF